MEKFVAKENERLLKKLEPQDLTSSVQTPWRNDDAAENRLRMYLRKLEELEKEVQFTRECEAAAFVRRVSIWNDLQDCS